MQRFIITYYWILKIEVLPQNESFKIPETDSQQKKVMMDMMGTQPISSEIEKRESEETNHANINRSLSNPETHLKMKKEEDEILGQDLTKSKNFISLEYIKGKLIRIIK